MSLQYLTAQLDWVYEGKEEDYVFSVENHAVAFDTLELARREHLR